MSVGVGGVSSGTGSRSPERLNDDRTLTDCLDRLEAAPFREPVAADHTDEYPDPEPINGHIPDYVAKNTLTGTRTIGEVERRGDTSHHTHDQHDAFSQAAAADPQLDFEVTWFNDERQDRDTHEDDGFLSMW